MASNDATTRSRRLLLAKLIAEGDGVPSIDGVIKGPNGSEETRAILDLLPLGHKVKMGNNVMTVVETGDRPENTIPPELKEYYKKNKSLPKIKTLR